jgi:hypothetical protein
MKQNQLFKQVILVAAVLASGPFAHAILSDGKQPTQLDTFMEDSLAEQKAIKKTYDDQQRLTRTNQFKPEDKSMVIELGSQLPDGSDGQETAQSGN